MNAPGSRGAGHARPWLLLVAACAAGTVAAEEATPVSAQGVYFGSLPMPGCTRADTLLQLHDDGHYVLQAHCVATLQTLAPEHGHWSLEWSGTCLRLTPDGGLMPAGRELARASESLLVLAADGCTTPIQDPRGLSLHRALPTTEEH